MTALITAAIALVGIYVAFSLFTSWANEQFATFIALRSKTLIAGVRAMIGEAATAQVFGHPLVSSLGERLSDSFPHRLGLWLEPLFSKCTAGLVGVRYAAGTATQADPYAATGTPTLRSTPYIASSLFATVMTDIVRGYGNAAAANDSAAKLGAGWSDLVAGLDALSANPSLEPLHRALAPIWRQAEGNYDAFVQALSVWYDTHMDRVSGWYKRSTQMILFWVATITVVAFNLDTLQMWNGFQSNVNVSNAIAGLSQGYASANAAAIASGKGVNFATLPLPTQDCNPGTSGSSCACPAGFVAKPQQPDQSAASPQYHCVADVSVLAQLPVGWSSAYRGPFAPGVTSADFWKNLLLKILGLAVTIAALMLGAPFWFDLLRSLVNVRSAGPVPPTTPSSPTT